MRNQLVRIRSGLQASRGPVRLAHDGLVLGMLSVLFLDTPVLGQPVGEPAWTRQFGGSGPTDDRGQAVAVDDAGNVYVAGEGGALPGQTLAGELDGFVRKYDITGNEVWTVQFGSSAREEARGIAVDDSGVYVMGQTAGTMPDLLSPSPGGLDPVDNKGTSTNLGGSDLFVRKLDLNGAHLWTAQFGVDTSDLARGISLGDGSGVYVTGLVGVDGALPDQFSLGLGDAFVRKYDSNGVHQWTDQFGSNDTDFGFGIAADGSGVYVAGRTLGTLPGQTNSGGDDAFLRKYDSNGTEVWTRQFGSSIFDSAGGVSVDASAVYVVGETAGTLPDQTTSGGFDAFVRKYDSTGNEVWTRQFGSSGSDVANGVSVDGLGGLYVVGQAGQNEALPDQITAGDSDAFVRKYDIAGVEEWTRQFGTSVLDNGLGVSVGTPGVYVTGATRGTLGTSSTGALDAFVRQYDGNGDAGFTGQFGGFGPVTEIAWAADHGWSVHVAGQTGGSLPDQTSAGGIDAFVRTYDEAGNRLWTRQFGTSGTDTARTIAVDASWVYAAGETDGALPGHTSSGGFDAFVRKYDSNGTEVWTRQFGTTVNDAALGVSVDASGVYVVGYTTGTLPDQTSGGNGHRDAFLRKYDAFGTELWTRQFGTAADDTASGVSVDASGVYIVGFTRGTLPGAENENLGGFDAFVQKYDQTGNEVWSAQFGTAADDVAFGVSVHANGVYVAGRAFGVLPDQSRQGAFVRKYSLDGFEEWTDQFGATAFDRANAISVNFQGVYLAGVTFAFLPDLPKGATPPGGWDAYARKYTHRGKHLWTYQFGTPLFDQAWGISTSISGGTYVAGQTDGTMPGQTSAGIRDAFVGKLPPTARWPFPQRGSDRVKP